MNAAWSDRRNLATLERVFRCIFFRVSDQQTAEDLTSQVFLKACEKLGQYRPRGPFMARLYAIARNTVIDHYPIRRQVVTLEDVVVQDGGADKPEVVLEAQFEFDRVQAAMQQLTGDQREVLVLRFIAEVRYRSDRAAAGLKPVSCPGSSNAALQALATDDGCKGRTTGKRMNDLEQILDDCLEEMASGTSSLEGCLVRYPQEAAELEPLLRAAAGLGYGREVRPSPAFKARTRAELVSYMQTHPRGGTPSVRSVVSGRPFWRITLSLTLLLVFLLASGTVYAQRAIPGDAFYGWKLTSERAWRAVSRDRVGTDLVIAGRRINEYLSVADDPGRSQRALRGYGEVLVRLRSEADNQTRGRIVPVLEDHARSLKDSGVLIPQLDDIIQEETGDITSPASSHGGPGVNNAARGPGAGDAHRKPPDPRGHP